MGLFGRRRGRGQLTCDLLAGKFNLGFFTLSAVGEHEGTVRRAHVPKLASRKVGSLGTIVSTSVYSSHHWVEHTISPFPRKTVSFPYSSHATSPSHDVHSRAPVPMAR